MQPTSAQRFLTHGSKARNPRDRPFVSTTGSTSKRSTLVGVDSTSKPEADSLFSSSIDDGALLDGSEVVGSSDSVTFPPIPAARRSAKGAAAPEWGETAKRKQAGSLQVTQRGMELLRLSS